MPLKVTYVANEELPAADLNEANTQTNANTVAIAALSPATVLEGTTTDATPAELESGVSVSANSVSVFDISVVAGDNSSSKGWNFKGTIRRDGAGNTSLGGVDKKTSFGEDDAAASWDVDVTADDTTETLDVIVTGQAATTIKWKAAILISKITF